MKKKFFAVALATTMVVSTAISASAESITGTAWWDAGNGKSGDYTLSGDGSVALDINFKEANGEGYGAFNVEVYNDGWYFTTGSDQNAWWAEGALKGDAATGGGTQDITGIAATPASTIVAGTTYKVTVTRAGSVITVTYANPDGTKYAEYVGTANDSIPSELKVHVMAQVGTYDVTEATSTPTDPTKATDPTTEAPKGDNPTTKAPAATTAGKTTPKTGDVAPVAALAAVAVVACAAVVVSKKKVTE